MPLILVLLCALVIIPLLFGIKFMVGCADFRFELKKMKIHFKI